MPASHELPYELQIGWRYTRAGRTRRNGFISFISAVSMLGIALGVAALIIVLSVMNGFQKEVRDRMLGVISHIEMFDAGGRRCPTGSAMAEQRARSPEVLGAAPFVAGQALLARGDDMRGAMVRGIAARPRKPASPTGARSCKSGTLRRRCSRANSASCSAPSWRARWACARRQGHAGRAAAARSRRPAWCRG